MGNQLFPTSSYVTGPAIIDHVSANYKEVNFPNIFCYECTIPFPYAAEECPLNSAVVMMILLWYYKWVYSCDRAKTNKIGDCFCAQMVDFCRPSHVCFYIYCIVI